MGSSAVRKVTRRNLVGDCAQGQHSAAGEVVFDEGERGTRSLSLCAKLGGVLRLTRGGAGLATRGRGTHTGRQLVWGSCGGQETDSIPAAWPHWSLIAHLRLVAAVRVGEGGLGGRR